METSRTLHRVLCALGLLCVLSAGRAEASITWLWNYAGDGINANGTFLTGDTADSAGFYEILALEGIRNGDAITGLVPSGTAIPGNEPFAVDNLIRLDGPGQITVEGFGYALASGAFANPYFADFLSPPAYSEVLTQGSSFSEVPIVFSASRVPEPATLALIAAALGAIYGARSAFSVSSRKRSPLRRRKSAMTARS